MKLQLEKPPAGGLGFSVIGGERGIFVKSVTPGGTADTAGTLQVGDRLLKVRNQRFWKNAIYCTQVLKANSVVVFMYRSMRI